MSRILFALLFVFVFVSLSQAAPTESMVAKSGTNYVRIYQKPCLEKDLLVNVKNEFKERFQAAEFKYKGRLIRACWIGAPDGYVYVIDADGDITPIPIGEFKADEVI